MSKTNILQEDDKERYLLRVLNHLGLTKDDCTVDLLKLIEDYYDNRKNWYFCAIQINIKLLRESND